MVSAECMDEDGIPNSPVNSCADHTDQKSCESQLKTNPWFQKIDA